MQPNSFQCYFADYETHGSLITLNISDQGSCEGSRVSSINISIEEDRLKEEHIQTEEEHSQKIIGGLESNSLIYQEVIEDVLDNTNVSIETIGDQDNIDKVGDDKTDDMLKTTSSDLVDSFDEITDTDSGIYSLYDSVMISRNMELGAADPDHEQERNSPILELDKKFLTDAFYEARSLKKLMDNLHEKSYQKHGQDTIHNIRVRQDTLKKLLINLELEKVENNESINGLKHKFFQQQATSHLFFTKFQSLLDQIDQITNLIFGIEMKIEKCSYNDFNIIDSEYWTCRLTEALALKTKHSESLVRLIKTNLCSENQFELQEKINIKQRQICQLKLIKAEIYCNEMQLKILFL